MNATILMRIMPDLRSKYAIRVDGETVGDLETLDEALLALERLRDRDFTVEQARKMLDVSVVPGEGALRCKKGVSAGKAERCNV